MQSVTCLTADPGLTADSRVASLILALSYTFAEIDHEIIFTVILLPPLIQEGFLSVKRKYVHKVLVICLS